MTRSGWWSGMCQEGGDRAKEYETIFPRVFAASLWWPGRWEPDDATRNLLRFRNRYGRRPIDEVGGHFFRIRVWRCVVSGDTIIGPDE